MLVPLLTIPDQFEALDVPPTLMVSLEPVTVMLQYVGEAETVHGTAIVPPIDLVSCAVEPANDQPELAATVVEGFVFNAYQPVLLPLLYAQFVNDKVYLP
jgi:hypothetical protein